MTRILTTLAVGKLTTWFFQTNGLLKPLEDRSELFRELRGCDLCSGFWVYLILTLTDKSARLFALPPLLDIVSSAMAYAYLAHLLSIGWMSENGTVYLDSWQPDDPAVTRNVQTP